MRSLGPEKTSVRAAEAMPHRSCKAIYRLNANDIKAFSARHVARAGPNF